ncbi:hypothetical protein [Magnetospira sp. QH-2]|uniref:hypothetical protein n=1 Tax=Magnetospira sp. (strain QH-2) TaxID=1288970 RepID=UPI0003E80A5E|nr:hypothetical protein [Magnetospira sp. QH-2]CCQ73615.1 Conserved protein of unknown function [Magnetospira sp. QH-2]
MAITRVEFDLFWRLSDLGHFPRAPRLLELGEQHWLGDVPVPDLVARCMAAAEDRPETLRRFAEDMAAVNQSFGPRAAFDLVKAFYGVVLNHRDYRAIDFVSPNGLRHDLNHPLPFKDLFDVVTNIGTAEHVFDTAQVYRTVHDHCHPNGLMIHTQPMTGQVNHGFYSVSPTLFLDLARVNDYEILELACAAFTPRGAYVPFTSLDDYKALEAANALPTKAVLSCVFRKKPE